MSGSDPSDSAFQPRATATVDAQGTATVVFVRVDPGPLTRAILATTGR